MERNEMTRPGYIGLEIAGDTVLDYTIDEYSAGKEFDYIKDRVALAFTKGNVPDTRIIVTGFSQMGNMPADPNKYFPGQFSADEYLLKMFSDKIILVDNGLRAAAFCVKEGYEPTQANMDALVLSERYPEFCEENRCKIGILDPNLRVKEETGKGYDDWSFLFRYPTSDFNTSEQKDILALGCILSNGIEAGLMNEDVFPSFRELEQQCAIDREKDYDFALQSYKLKQAAIEILERKYPQILSTVKELCGLSPWPEYNNTQIFAIVNKSGGAVDAITNANEFQNFFDYARLTSQDKSLQERAEKDSLKIVWYGSLDRSLLPTQLTTGIELWDHMRVVAEQYHIKPAASLNFNDAVYCFKNGRNPLHPDNRQEKLLKEDTYRRYCTELKKKHDIHQKLEYPTKKHDRKPVINRHPQKKNKNSLKIR